jgi:hypothetical protein
MRVLGGRHHLYDAGGGGLSHHPTARRVGLLGPLHDLGLGGLRRDEHGVRVRDLAAHPVHRVSVGRSSPPR